MIWTEKLDFAEEEFEILSYLSHKMIVVTSTTCILIEQNIKKTSEEVEVDGDDFLLDYQPIQEDPIKMLNYVTSESQEGKKYPPVNSDKIIYRGLKILVFYTALSKAEKRL